MYLHSATVGREGAFGCAYEARGRGRVALTPGNGIGLLARPRPPRRAAEGGVITRAEIVGRDVEVGGHLFASRFPEIVEEIRRRRRGGDRNSIDSFRTRLVKAGVIHAAVSPLESGSWTEGYRLRASLRAATLNSL